VYIQKGHTSHHFLGFLLFVLFGFMEDQHNFGLLGTKTGKDDFS
jgi:hypothetical protein